MQGTPWLPENALDSQEELWCMEWASKYVIKYLFIITNTMHTLGVDKITLFKTI